MFSGEVVRQIGAVAERNGVEAAALEAVCDVESAGTAFWFVDGRSVPPMRPEAHYFYRLLPPNRRNEAVRAGLANPNAGAIRVPANREAVYARLARMKAIDENAALQSCSWGVGQVMGSNYRALGFDRVQELVEACNTVAGQVDVMWRFIKHNHLDDELARHDWAGFARGYNGAGYRKNAYDRMITQAYNKYKVHGSPVVVPAPLRAEVQDPTVAEFQRKLMKLGYVCPTTGKLDEQTHLALKKFQSDNGLVPDGEYSAMTRDCLDAAVATKNKAQGDALVGTGLGTGAGSAGLDQVNDQLQQSTWSLQSLGSDSHIISYIVMGLALVTVALVAYGLYKKFRG